MAQQANIDELRKILAFVSKGYKVPKIIHDVIFDVAVREVEDTGKVVLVKRDPNIDRGRIQAVKVKVIEGECLDMHPGMVGQFGADFDGDSCCSHIVIYKSCDGEFVPIRMHISEFSRYFDCELIDHKITGEKVVDNYLVKDVVYADAISADGSIEKKRITNWSTHSNLNMYSISRKKKRSQISDIRDLWVSDNHSVVCIDMEEKSIKKVTPEEILKNPSRFFLIRNLKKSKQQYNASDFLYTKTKEDSASEGELGYIIGALLGDGDISRNLPMLSSATFEMGMYFSDLIQKVYKNENKIIRDLIYPNVKAHPYDLISKDGKPYKTAGLWGSRCLGPIDFSQFGHKCHDKHLPEWVINSTEDFAIGLLAGYIDTDGSVNCHSSTIDIQSKSRDLINDVIFLFNWKFGIRGSFFTDKRTSKLGPYGTYVALEEGECLEYYSLYFSINQKTSGVFIRLLEYMKHPKKVSNLKECLNRNHATVVRLKWIPNEILGKKGTICGLDNLSEFTADAKYSVRRFNYTQKSIQIPREVIDNFDISGVYKKLLYMQENEEIEIIPCSALDIKLDPNQTIGYDFTVEDFATFTTDTGIFLFDTMGIMVPISEEAQQEAKDKMMSAVTNSSKNDPAFELSKETLTGLYTITIEDNKNVPVEIKNIEDARKLHPGTQVKIKIKGEMIATTAGRVMFNEELPEWYDFVNVPIDKKQLKGIFSKIINKDRVEFAHTMDRLMKLGFKMCTIYPRTVSLDLMTVPDNIKALNTELKNEKDVVKQNEIVNKMTSMLMDHLKNNNKDLYQQIASGAAKGGDQIRQIMVSKGLVTDSDGNILPPIAKAMNDGYTPEEYFNASHGARKGVSDRALSTSDGGYTYRKMIYVMGSTECDETILDCGTKHFLNIKLTDELFKRMSGRYHSVNGKLQPVTKDYVGKFIQLRSPIFCRTEKICARCYGELIYQLQSKHCGIISAMQCTSLSEKIMKSFHLGGIATMSVPDMVPMLSENIEDSYVPIVKNGFNQQEMTLYSNSEFVVMRIDENIFKDPYLIIDVDSDTLIELPVGHFTLDVDGFTIPVTIEKKTLVHVKEKERADKMITLTYGKGDKIFTLDASVMSAQETARMVDKLVGGKSPWTNPESLLTMFFKLLKQFGGWDLVHLEVIVSAILRDRKDPQSPARMKFPYDPVTFSLKKLPGIMSWPLAIAFENFGKAIATGMTSDRAPSSSIEKVLFGDSLSGLDQPKTRKK
jgi:hypothetical protein